MGTMLMGIVLNNIRCIYSDKSKMTRCLSFSNNVSVLCENGEIKKKTMSSKLKKRKKTPLPINRRLKLTYNQQQAHCVAKRIKVEINNPQLYELRHREELIVESLLARYNFYTKINKVYRLSNISLIVLKRRLTFM